MSKYLVCFLWALILGGVALPDEAVARRLEGSQYGPPAIAAPAPSGLVAVIPNNPDTPLDLSAFDNPAISGVALQIHWADIENSATSPDWSRLDALFDRADATHKWVQLLIFPGFFSPSWALAGATTAPFDIQYGPGGGESKILPMPWDGTYLANWFRFARQVASRYGHRASFRVMAAAGPTSVSAEATLPDKPADIEKWSTLGYTSDKYVAAWRSVFEEFASDFPNQYVSLSLGGGVKLDKGLRPTTQDLIQAGHEALAGRFIIQNSNLGPNPGSESKSLLAANIGKMIAGYQMATSATQTARKEGGDPATLLKQAIENGTAPSRGGGQIDYLEVYNADVSAPELQTVLQYGASLFPPTRPR